MSRLFLYRQTSLETWTAGHVNAAGMWVPESDHRTPENAARRVHLLNYREARNPEPEVDPAPRSLFETMSE